MEKPKYTSEGLPIVSKKLAEQHIEELMKAAMQNNLEGLLHPWQQQIMKEQPALGNYMAELSKQISVLQGEDQLKVMGYQGGFSDMHYLLRKASDKPLPRLSSMWGFPSSYEILQNRGTIKEELISFIEQENPYVVYYFKRRFGNDSKSMDIAERDHAVFFREGFFGGYILFREQALRNKTDQN